MMVFRELIKIKILSEAVFSAVLEVKIFNYLWKIVIKPLCCLGSWFGALGE